MERILACACVLAAALLAQPAAAQSADKAEAILGAPSKLAALIAQQNGGQPSLSVSAPAIPSAAAMPFESGAPALTTPALSSDTPDVFGSVALPVRSTPLDDRWSRVRSAGVHGELAGWAHRLRAYPVAERIAAINSFVNGRVHFAEDRREFRSADLWQSASNTLRRKRGDCEDYAIAKLQLLRAAGVNSNDIYLVIARDLIRRADHAVLVVRGERRMMLLDNGTDTIGDAAQDQSYRPVLSFSATGRAWTHGYKRPPELQVAAASSSPIAAAAVVSGALR